MAHALTRIPRILFFIKGTLPTLEQSLEADKLAPMRVSFRNANLVPEDGALEACDGWHGEDTPKRYRKAYPTAEEAAENYTKAREEAYAAKAKAADDAKKAGLDATAAEAKANADKAAADKKKTDEAAKKAKEDADAKAKAAAAWKPNA
ncbi:hypothetical protein [Paracoccus phage vB_PmaS-R3]|uniref:Uncharacterized protein n=1 Tax=Paracoccus phage vB_PmaS-R3 TaxID=2494563 RepID=A0A0B5A5A9_9CAUD|nr:hypothetical protein VC48_gp40 [Paracoccus phage vB_PmaS-R3]AJD83164.1 hypothetical protein [Paracoccus phage vB_PmaS-R3]